MKNSDELDYIQDFFLTTGLTAANREVLEKRIAGFNLELGPTNRRSDLGNEAISFADNIKNDSEFWQTIEQRRTDRNFSKKPVAFSDLKQLILGSFGKNRRNEGCFLYRSPSCGGLFGLQGYLVAKNIEGLTGGLYYIENEEEKLIKISSKTAEKWEKLIFADKSIIDNAAAIFIICGDLTLTHRKYGLRAARYCFLDAGHVMQNICLSARAQNIKILPLGGFDEEKLRSVLKIKNFMEFPIYACVIGK